MVPIHKTTLKELHLRIGLLVGKLSKFKFCQNLRQNLYELDAGEAAVRGAQVSDLALV